jgi:hypothetical protein
MFLFFLFTILTIVKYFFGLVPFLEIEPQYSNFCWMTSCTASSLLPISESILLSMMNCFISVIHRVKKSAEHLILCLPDSFLLVSFPVVFSIWVLYRYFHNTCVTYSGNVIRCAYLFVFTYEQYCIFDIRCLVGYKFFCTNTILSCKILCAFVLMFTPVQSFTQVFSLQILVYSKIDSSYTL